MITRKQCIKLLAAQEVYDAIPDDKLYHDGRYLTIYDILATIDIPKEEVVRCELKSFEDLGK